MAGTLHCPPHHLALLGAATIVITLQFSSPVRGPVPGRPEMGVEPRILPQTANLAFHLDHEKQLLRLQESLGRLLFEAYGRGSATNHGWARPGGHSRQLCCGLSSLLSPQSLTPLHSFLCPIQRPFQHRNWSEAQWGLPGEGGRKMGKEGGRPRSHQGRAWVSKRMGACHFLG